MTWLLRGVGTFLLLFGVGGGSLRFFTARVERFDLYDIFVPIVAALVLALLCFAAAEILATVRRTDERIAQASMRRRAARPETKDLAPVAPKWDELPAPLPYDGSTERRLARKQRLGDPLMPNKYEVISQPPVVRETPGWKYADPPPDPPRRSSYDPRLSVEEQRQLLRMSRDNALKRLRNSDK